MSLRLENEWKQRRNSIHFEILLQKKEECTQAKKIYDVYGHDAVSVRMVQSWFNQNVFNLEILISKMHLALVD